MILLFRQINESCFFDDSKKYFKLFFCNSGIGTRLISQKSVDEMGKYRHSAFSSAKKINWIIVESDSNDNTILKIEKIETILMRNYLNH